MTDNLLKGAATLCLIAVTLTCLALTAFLAIYLKALLRSMPPPTFVGDWGMGIAQNGHGWGPEQATGEPNSPFAGDQLTAWASLTTDGQEEWLQLTYSDPVDATAVVVYETHNPGAVVKVTAIDGESETVLWEGDDPVKIENGIGVAEIPVSPSGPVKTVKLTIASPKVAGWNEIDAVGLRDKDGTLHWAATAIASSTYAEPPLGYVPPDPYAEHVKSIDERLMHLEELIKSKQ